MRYSIGTILLQAIAIVAIATGIGLADSARRPAKLTREAPPALPDPSSPPNPTTAATALPPSSTPVAPPAPVESAPAALPVGHITVAQAKALFDNGAKFIDARAKDDYEKGHVRDAFRVLQSAFAAGDPPALAMIMRSEVVVVYCNGGHCDESEGVARMLDQSGYKKVYVMHDGFPGWKTAGHPSDTGPGAFPDP